jgi:hypothetical protein
MVFINNKKNPIVYKMVEAHNSNGLHTKDMRLKQRSKEIR